MTLKKSQSSGPEADTLILGLGSPLAAPVGRFEPLGSPKSSNRPESLNLLFPQACVIRESFPRPFAIPPPQIRPFAIPILGSFT